MQAEGKNRKKIFRKEDILFEESPSHAVKFVPKHSLVFTHENMAHVMDISVIVSVDRYNRGFHHVAKHVNSIIIIQRHFVASWLQQVIYLKYLLKNLLMNLYQHL